jgi:hypothetical protein
MKIRTVTPEKQKPPNKNNETITIKKPHPGSGGCLPEGTERPQDLHRQGH